MITARLARPYDMSIRGISPSLQALTSARHDRSGPDIMARWTPRSWFLVLLVVLTTSGCTGVAPPPPDEFQTVESPVTVARPEEPPVCLTAPVVTNGRRDRMRIALTFDACTTRKNEYNERVVNTLLETGTPATLFIGGGWAEANPERLQALARHPGFEFGNHTFTHAHMPAVKDNTRALEELRRTQRAVYDLTGRIPRYFRPPFGEVDRRVAWLASEAGLVTLNFDLPSGDPDETVTAKRLVDWVLQQARPGSIVVMHMNHKRFPTADALPDIIHGLRKRGYELVTVGTLLEDADAPPLCLPPPAESKLRPVVAEVNP